MLLDRRLIAAALLVAGLLGCLRSFAPNLRPRGVHGELPVASPNATCMGCHESEADALARMRAGESISPADSTSGLHRAGRRNPDTPGPPLVADWMISEPQPCTSCHRMRG